MSNSLAIATVTATLKTVLKASIDRALDHLPGGTDLDVTTVRPTAAGTGLPKKGVNIFLYQVTPNPTWRNADLPARRGDGDVIRKPQAALDLHYLLSFHGDDTHWEPQRLLGIIEQTLHARPLLSRATIKRTIDSIGANPGYEFITSSNLHEADDLVRFSPMNLSLEELSKLWSVLLQTTYTLSTVWQAQVVLIEAEEMPQPARPVREVTFRVTAAGRPVLDQVVDATDATTPITYPGRIALLGQSLRGDVTRVLIDGDTQTPVVTEVWYDKILLDLPVDIRAGLRGAQVAHLIALGDPPTPHRGPESNVVPFVVHPRITGAIAKGAIVTADDGTISTDLTVPLAPDLGREQRAVIQLNSVDGVTPPRAYSFVAPERPAPPPAADPTVLFHIAGVEPGSYDVHILVDGAYDAPLDAVNQVDLP